MLKIAIAEDSKQDLDLLLSSLEYTKSKLNLNYVIDHYDTGLKLLGNFNSNYDIIFLDIEMPGIDGLETARQIRNNDKHVIIIFITNLAQMAINGYEVEALDFILKPINKDVFYLKMERAISRIATKSSDNLIIKNKGEVTNIRIDSIRYVESDDHYVIYHTVDGDFREYSTLKDAEKRISSNSFTRCNQCFLVNMSFISKIIQSSVFVGDDELAISRPQKKVFMDRYTKYLSGEIE